MDSKQDFDVSRLVGIRSYGLRIPTIPLQNGKWRVEIIPLNITTDTITLDGAIEELINGSNTWVFRFFVPNMGLLISDVVQIKKWLTQIKLQKPNHMIIGVEHLK